MMSSILIVALSFAVLGTVISLGMLWKSEKKIEEKPSKEKTKQLTDLFITTETDLISIPHVGIGRYLKVSEKKDDGEGYKLVVEGLLVASYLTAKNKGENLAVQMVFLNKEGKTVSYKIPITPPPKGQPQIYVETIYTGTAVPKPNMFIKDLAEFCNNQEYTDYYKILQGP